MPISVHVSTARSTKARRTLVIGVICALSAVALYAGFTLVSRLGRAAEMPVLDLAALRFGIGGLILTPVLLRHGLGGVSVSSAVVLAVLGGLGFALLAYCGLYLAPAAHGAVLLHGTLPLTTLLVLSVVDRTQIRCATLAGIALIALGVGFMAWASVRDASSRQLAGDALLLLASLCWSAYGITVRRLELAPLRAAAIVAVVSMCCFLPPYIAVRGTALFSNAGQDLLVQALFQGVLIGIVSIFVYTRAVTDLGASETAVFTAAVPGVTTVGAIALLAEWPTPAEWAGVGLATLGMLVAIRGLYRTQRTAQ